MTICAECQATVTEIERSLYQFTYNKHISSAIQPISPRTSKSHPKIPPTPTPRSKALTLQHPKAAVISNTSSLSQTIEKKQCGVAAKSSIRAHAVCEPTEAVAQVSQAHLNECRKFSQEKRVAEDEEAAKL